VRPRLSDDRLTVDVTLATGSATLAVVGVLSAVAIPAFIKYIKKSKTIEARENVKRLHDSVIAYYHEHGKLPASTPLSPANPKACCEKCAPDARLWTDARWSQLQFSVDAPHYYAYQLVVGNDRVSGGRATAFTVRAMGDLDCDGVMSTFEMYGQVIDGKLRVGDDIYRQRELE